MAGKPKIIRWSGEPISAPGIYDGIPIDTYHSANICNGLSVSSSHLRRLAAQSPAHFFAYWPGNPECLPSQQTRATIRGRAAHHLFLSESFFAGTFVAEEREYPDAKTGVMKPWTYQANYCKQWRMAQEEKGLTILTPDDLDALRGMAASLERHPIVRAGALNGLIEQSIFWRDEVTGLWLKVRPDAIPQSSVDFVDLKTTKSVLYPDLQRTIEHFGYHQQGALICRAARDVLRIPSPSFTLVFVESAPPYCVRVVTLKDEDLARGDKQNRSALDTVTRCLKSGHWPGPGGESSDAEYIELPEWAQKRIDDAIEV